MDSSPPASTTCAEAARIWSAASITAFSPEPHILLTVVHGTLTGTPAPTAAWRAGAGPRPQSALKYGDERLRDLRTGKALVLTIPVRNPVERAGERKRGHFRIARLNGAVLHTLADQPPDAVIDLGLQCLDVAAHRRRQVLILGAHHAPAEFGGHRLAVMAQHGIQALAR